MTDIVVVVEQPVPTVLEVERQGPEGPQGIQGPQGEQGDTGPQGPAGPAGEDGVAIKGPWDMTSGGGGGSVTSYPLDGDLSGLGYPLFPVVAGDTHGYVITEGTGTDSDFYAIDQQSAEGVLSDYGNLQIPDAGIVAVEFVFTTDAEAAPLPSGRTNIHANIAFMQAGYAVQFVIKLVFENSHDGVRLDELVAYIGAPSNSFWRSGALPLTLNTSTRVTVYIDGATRQIGFIVDGVDTGYITDPDTSDPIVIPAAATGVSIIKTGNFTNIESGDPIIGATQTLTHNINPATMADAGLLPALPQEWNLSGGGGDATLPDGAESGDVFEVTVGGTYQGVTFAVGDLAVVRSNGTSVTRLPAASISATESAAAIDAAVASLTGTVAAFANLPSAADNAGRERYVTAARCWFRSNGTAWVQTSVGEFTAAEKDALDPANFPSGMLVTVTGAGAGIYRNTGSAFSPLADAGQKIYVDVFTSSANWTKRTGARWVRGKLVGGGGGGGGGRMSDPGTSASGGGGGGGGGVTDFEMAAADLPSTVSVVVGAGGLGGAARTAVNDGTVGAAGGDTQFGSYWHVKGASTTLAAGTASGISGSGGIGYPNSITAIGGYYNSGGSGGNGQNTTGTAGAASLYSPQGGGGGGGVGSGGSTGIGGSAAERLVTNTSGPFVGYSTNNGGGINTNGSAGANSPMPSSGLGGQGGSGGGGSSSSAPAGNGGNGGFPGGGGGGGGGATTASPSSGAGGNGGNGLAIIITYCE